MKKVIMIVFMLFLIFSLNGCADKKLTYYGNLGYDLSEINYKSIEFNIYHSNSNNHTWELLSSLSCLPKKDHFIDVKLEGAENCVTISTQYNRVEKTENHETNYTEDIDTYQFGIDGFSGWIDSFQNFEIKDTEKEQFYRLYPISNGDSVLFHHLKLDKPYDENEENLDNILITMTINKR